MKAHGLWSYSDGAAYSIGEAQSKARGSDTALYPLVVDTTRRLKTHGKPSRPALCLGSECVRTPSRSLRQTSVNPDLVRRWIEANEVEGRLVDVVQNAVSDTVDPASCRRRFGPWTANHRNKQRRAVLLVTTHATLSYMNSKVIPSIRRLQDLVPDGIDILVMVNTPSIHPLALMSLEATGVPVIRTSLIPERTEMPENLLQYAKLLPNCCGISEFVRLQVLRLT